MGRTLFEASGRSTQSVDRALWQYCKDQMKPS